MERYLDERGNLSEEPSCDREYQSLRLLEAPWSRDQELSDIDYSSWSCPVVSDEAFAAKNCVILVRIWRRETASPTRKSAELGDAMARCEVGHGWCASAE
jgi:hypothetical protein